MSTFVLVHGAMHGGWCWKDVAPILLSHGHQVFAPTLTGMGERVHLVTKETGVQTHVTDIANLLFYHDLTDVILVGHSYAGVVIEQVANDCPERLKALVHLHSFVPTDGQCLWEIESEATRTAYKQMSDQFGNGWLLVPQRDFVTRWGISGDLVDWVFARLTAFPMKCQFDSVSLKNPIAAALPRTYVVQTGEPMHTILAPFEQLAQTNDWRIETLDTQHDSMLTVPDRVASLLERVASSSKTA